MNRSVFQVPVNPDLRKDAEMEAIAQGFSSLQEAVRVFLRKLAQGKIEVTFEEKAVQLSPKAIRRYDNMINDIEKGRNVYEVKDVDDLMRQLNAKA